jgi:hypothetical protein
MDAEADHIPVLSLLDELDAEPVRASIFSKSTSGVTTLSTRVSDLTRDISVRRRRWAERFTGDLELRGLLTMRGAGVCCVERR